MKVSVIVSTYNQLEALALVLNSLEQQTVSDFEIVVADDGSTGETRALIEKKRKELFGDRLIHAWQPDDGFRAAAARNAAVRLSQGEYLIFLDGDCIPFPSFVENHIRLSEKGYFVTGNRVLCSPKLTQELIQCQSDLKLEDLFYWLKLRWQGKINRWTTLFQLPSLNFVRKLRPNAWKYLRTCNCSLWRKDFISVNGFDEDFVGWGFEDSDLAVRLINLGIRRKSGNFAATVLHLYHQERKVPKEGKSWETVTRRLVSGEVKVGNGLQQANIR